MNEFTSIDQAITDLTERNNFIGNFANLVQRTECAKNTPMNRIATAFANLKNEQAALRAKDELDNGTRAKDMDIKPMSVFSFLQAVQNRITSNAHRAIWVAVNDQSIDGEDAALTDFASATLEELGHAENTVAESIADQCTQDYTMLLKVHAYISKFYRGMDLEPLYMSEFTEYDGELDERFQLATALNWDETFQVREVMRERAKAREMEALSDAQTMDFAA